VTGSDADPVVLPGGRDVRGSLDRAGDVETAAGTDGSACVVACPPHPQHGGSRADGRLRAVGDTLAARGVDCLRFDYGPWDEGRGERVDAEAALAWARDRYARVGLFGYSFGGAVAAVAAADADPPPAAVSLLAPAATLPSGEDAAAAVARGRAPLQVVCGSRDERVDRDRVVEAARAADAAADREVVTLDAGHGFVGEWPRVGTVVAEFQVRHLE
jgi:hypothetical protein